MWCKRITHKSVKWNWCGKIVYDLSPGPSSPRNVQADALSINAVRLHWQPPEDPNGGIVKYSIEYEPVGQSSFHPWVDTDDGNKTMKDVTSLNGSTLYQFRVRAFSRVPGKWSKFVQARTRGDGKWPEWINVGKTYCKAEIQRHYCFSNQAGFSNYIPTTQQVGRPMAEDHQLLWAVVGSVAVTCVTILLALLILFYIRKSVIKRKRTFTYQSGSVSGHFNFYFYACVCTAVAKKKFEQFWAQNLLYIYTLYFNSST